MNEECLIVIKIGGAYSTTTWIDCEYTSQSPLPLAWCSAYFVCMPVAAVNRNIEVMVCECVDQLRRAVDIYRIGTDQDSVE